MLSLHSYNLRITLHHWLFFRAVHVSTFSPPFPVFLGMTGSPLFPIFPVWEQHMFTSSGCVTHSLTDSKQWCQRVQPVKANINIVRKHITQYLIYILNWLLYLFVYKKGRPLQEVKLWSSVVQIKCRHGCRHFVPKKGRHGCRHFVACKWPPQCRPFVKQNGGAHVSHFVRPNWLWYNLNI